MVVLNKSINFQFIGQLVSIGVEVFHVLLQTNHKQGSYKKEKEKKLFANLSKFLRMYSKKNIIKSGIINVFIKIAKKERYDEGIICQKKSYAPFPTECYCRGLKQDSLNFICTYSVKIFVYCFQTYLHDMLFPHPPHICFKSNLMSFPPLLQTK